MLFLFSLVEVLNEFAVLIIVAVFLKRWKIDEDVLCIAPVLFILGLLWPHSIHADLEQRLLELRNHWLNQTNSLFFYSCTDLLCIGDIL